MPQSEQGRGHARITQGVESQVWSALPPDSLERQGFRAGGRCVSSGHGTGQMPEEGDDLTRSELYGRASRILRIDDAVQMYA